MLEYRLPRLTASLANSAMTNFRNSSALIVFMLFCVSRDGAPSGRHSIARDIKQHKDNECRETECKRETSTYMSCTSKDGAEWGRGTASAKRRYIKRLCTCASSPTRVLIIDGNASLSSGVQKRWCALEEKVGKARGRRRSAARRASEMQRQSSDQESD